MTLNINNTELNILTEAVELWETRPPSSIVDAVAVFAENIGGDKDSLIKSLKETRDKIERSQRDRKRTGVLLRAKLISAGDQEPEASAEPTPEPVASVPVTERPPEHVIISANYLDRESPTKWLIRDDNDTAEPKPASSVVAANVTFKRSPKYEEGFGCYIVATGIIGPSDKRPDNAVRLKLRGSSFVDPDNKYVDKVRELYLEKDGSIYAVI